MSSGSVGTATRVWHVVFTSSPTLRVTSSATHPQPVSSVENGNPLFWDDAVADELTGGPIAPPSMLSTWFRPHHWAPGRTKQALPLQVHFDMKERFDLPEAVMSDNSLTFYEPVRPGDVLSTRQVLRSVSDEKTTKLGTGRFWEIDVEYQNQNGELVGVESWTGFGYRR